MKNGLKKPRFFINQNMPDFPYRENGRPSRRFKPVWLFLFFFLLLTPCHADEIGYASWYSVESCKREGTSGIMANGEVLKDEKLTCASWFYEFGTTLRITNLQNGKEVIVEVCDRGPAKWLVKKGRITDLSKLAFSQLDKLEKGIIKVRIEVIKTTSPK